MSKAIAIFLLFFGCISIGPPAVAQMPPVLELFEAPALELGVSKDVTVAIAGVESGLSPWVLNIEGQPFRFDSKEKALEKAREAWGAGRSFDLGLMQVNNWWLKRYGVSLEAALDPAANVYFGSWILKQEIDRRGDLRAAAGAYHSPSPARANHYADQVMEALKRGPQPAEAPAEGPPKAKAQGAGADQPPEAPEKRRRMLVAAEKPQAPSGAAMIVVTKKAGPAIPESMKAAATLPDNSMKVQPKEVKK